MTLHPALARLARGATRLYWDLPKRLILGARAYRFDGEQAAHAEQLRETEIALALMQSPSDDPDHVRMASEIEHGAENRLSVLLGKARLTMEEKGERDAIQRAISARRQSFAATSPDFAPTSLRLRFLGPLAASPAIGLLMSPYTWLVALGAFCVLQMGLKERVENQRDEARRELAEAEESLLASVELTRRLQRDINAANQDSAQTAATIEAERARRLRAEAEARRIRNEQRRAIEHVPDIDYGFGSVRDAGAGGSPGAGSGDATGRDPG